VPESAVRTIYLDESGYSGSNYLDEKPLFVVASLAIEPDEATALKSRFFGGVKANELKHSQLVRRPRQRAMVLDFLAHLSTVPNTSKTWLVDKEYAAWLKVVDHIIEPLLHAGGLNVYREGGNLAMATMLGHCIPAFTNMAYSHTLLERAITFIKTSTEPNRAALIEWLELGKVEFPSSEVTETLDYVLLPLRVLPPDALKPPLGAADMAFGAALHLMAWWRTDVPESIRLIHDATANMARQKEVWDAITDQSLPEHRSAAASGMVLTYPIAVQETTFDSSEEHDGLQLADVLAGALGCSLEARVAGERGDYVRLSNTIHRELTNI